MANVANQHVQRRRLVGRLQPFAAIFRCFCLPFFFFNDTATTEIYTLSLHDALPISACQAGLVAYSAHRWQMLHGGSPAPAPGAWWSAGGAPHLLVQPSVRHEPAVVTRLEDAPARAARDRERTRLQSRHTMKSYCRLL